MNLFYSVGKIFNFNVFYSPETEIDQFDVDRNMIGKIDLEFSRATVKMFWGGMKRTGEEVYV